MVGPKTQTNKTLNHGEDNEQPRHGSRFDLEDDTHQVSQLPEATSETAPLTQARQFSEKISEAAPSTSVEPPDGCLPRYCLGDRPDVAAASCQPLNQRDKCKLALVIFTLAAITFGAIGLYFLMAFMNKLNCDSDAKDCNKGFRWG